MSSNRTEVAPSQEENATPVYQHLAPALPARSAGRSGEPMVMAIVPKSFEITLSDGSRQRVKFEVGNYPIPARFKKHFYLKANGVTFADEMPQTQKPELEAPAAWPTEDELKAAKFDDLGLILKAHGVSDEDLKALGSKDLRRAKVAEMMAADETEQ